MVAAGDVRCRHSQPDLAFGLTVFGDQGRSSMRGASRRFSDAEEV
jgi:hypothetical protein